MGIAYWKGAVDQAFCDAGIWDRTTEEQRSSVAANMERAAEMESEATGRIYIPNPLQSEVDARDRALKAANAEAERQVEAVQKEINNFWRPLTTRLRRELSDARATS